MCFYMYIDVCAHACLYVHFRNIPPQVAGSPPPPPPQYYKASYAYEPRQQFLGHRLKHKIILLSFLKVRKDANLSNRYTQVRHLTQDTPSGSDKTQ